MKTKFCCNVCHNIQEKEEYCINCINNVLLPIYKIIGDKTEIKVIFKKGGV